MTEERTIDVGELSLRVRIRRGAGIPLLIFNGIGASYELLDPFVDALKDVEVIVFDVPGIGGSSPPRLPYRFSGMARLVEKMLDLLGYRDPVDVLGVSWGGAAAQQFAFTCRKRCRRLVLAATTAGVLMVPGKPSLLRFMLNGRRFTDPVFMQQIAPDFYGGQFRRNPQLARDFAEHMNPPGLIGYLYQQAAFLGWTSIHWLMLLPQRTLVVSGKDDPLAPSINGRILSWLIPKARLHLVDDGHLFLVTSADTVAPVVMEFLRAAD